MTDGRVMVRCRKCLDRGEPSPSTLAVVTLRNHADPLVVLAGQRVGNRDLARRFQPDSMSEVTFAEALEPRQHQRDRPSGGAPYSALVGSTRVRSLPVRGGDVRMPWTRTSWVLVNHGNHPVRCSRGHRTQIGVGRVRRRAQEATRSGHDTIYE